MSSVIANNKKLYKKAFLIEIILIVIFSLSILGFFSLSKALSFILGALAAYIPQVTFILYNLYTKNSKSNTISMSSFYQGEGIKFALTVVLLALIFIFTQIQPFMFFSGYLLFILLNVLLPLLLQKK